MPPTPEQRWNQIVSRTRRVTIWIVVVFPQFGSAMREIVWERHTAYNSSHIIVWCILTPLFVFALTSEVNGLHYWVRVEQVDSIKRVICQLLAWMTGTAFLAICFGFFSRPTKLNRDWCLVGVVVSGILMATAALLLDRAIRHLRGRFTHY